MGVNAPWGFQASQCTEMKTAGDDGIYSLVSMSLFEPVRGGKHPVESVYCRDIAEKSKVAGQGNILVIRSEHTRTFIPSAREVRRFAHGSA